MFTFDLDHDINTLTNKGGKIMTDYGHWTTIKEFDPREWIGFVYVITFTNGKKYIGAKKMWRKIKRPPTSFKRGPKCGFIESDWRNYTSSSNEVNTMISDGHCVEEYLIVGVYDTWGKTLYSEAMMQIENNVLHDDVWLNKQIGGHFNPNCYSELTEDDIAKYISCDIGNIHTEYPMMYKHGHKTKYVNPTDVPEFLNKGWAFGRSNTEVVKRVATIKVFQIYDTENDVLVEVRNQSQFARDNGLDHTHVSRLLTGDIDELSNGKFTLPKEIRRKRFELVDENGKSYFSILSAGKSKGLGRGKLSKKTFSKYGFTVVCEDLESKTQYKKRLKNGNGVSYETVVVSDNSNDFKRIMERSFVDVIESLTLYYSENNIIGDPIEWLKNYINLKLKEQHSL